MAAALLAGLFLPKFALARSSLAPEQISPRLAHELRAGGYRVAEKPGRIDVRIGRVAALKVWVRPDPPGVEVRYQLDATPTGWGVIMFFTIIVGFALGLVAIPTILYVFVRVHRFAEGRIDPLVSRLSAGGVSPPEDVRAMLVDGLAEARRFAEEAYEAERTSHQDAHAVVLFATLLVWVFLLIGLLLSLPPADPWRRGANPLLVATGSAAALGLTASALVWRHFRARIRSYRAWAERLRAALRLETSRTALEGPAPSAFETLMEASAEVPRWIEAHRRAGLSRDPAAGFLLVGMAIWTITLLEGAVVSAGYGAPLQALFGGAAIGLSLALYAFYRRWKRTWEASARRSLAEWRRRLDEARGRMERYLQEL